MSGSRPSAANVEVPPAAPAKALRVCHIASGDLWAGAEVQVATLLRELSRRPELQLSAILLNDGRLAREVRECGVPVTIIPEDRHGFLEIAALATRELRGRGIDILHSHRYKENLLAALVARRCRIPHLVRTQHGMPEPVPLHKNPKRATLHLLDSLVARHRADRIIAVSREMTALLARRLPAAKITLIYNGIDLERVRSAMTPEQAKARLGFAGDTPVIGTAGRLVPIKRLDLLLRAAQQLAQRSPATRFLIVGDGPERQALEELAAGLGIANRVLFSGHRDDVHDLMRAMDIFTLTSDHEGLPMALLEAMALGIPVVARAVGGMVEVVAEGTGVLVGAASADLAAGYQGLLEDAPARRRMGAAAVEHISRSFSSAATANAALGLYRSLVRA